MNNPQIVAIEAEMRAKGWWIMNQAESAVYRKEALRRDVVPDEVNFLSLSYKTGLDEGWMAKIGQLVGLRCLYLDCTDVTDAGLAQLETLPKLLYLNLRGTSIGNAGLSSIAKLKTLTYLWLSDTKITGRTLHQLRSLESLNHLFLDGTEVNDDHLAGLGGLPNLEVLFASYTRLTNRSLPVFEEFPKLRMLEIPGTQINEADLAHLRDRLPNLHASIFDPY